MIHDARGHLLEPHNGTSIPVGTTQVRDYLLPRSHRPADLVAVDAALQPTLGPENRFSTLLYIEKEGFEPLLRAAGIPERFDCAIMSTKGMSVTAARLIVDRYAQQGVLVLVAHDFERAGATIAWTLGNSTRRYRFEKHPGVVDIGLNLAEARAMGLQDEEAPDAGPKEDKLREYGLGEEEIDFLVYRHRRVELNAQDGASCSLGQAHAQAERLEHRVDHLARAVAQEQGPGIEARPLQVGSPQPAHGPRAEHPLVDPRPVEDRDLGVPGVTGYRHEQRLYRGLGALEHLDEGPVVVGERPGDVPGGVVVPRDVQDGRELSVGKVV